MRTNFLVTTFFLFTVGCVHTDKGPGRGPSGYSSDQYIVVVCSDAALYSIPMDFSPEPCKQTALGNCSFIKKNDKMYPAVSKVSEDNATYSADVEGTRIQITERVVQTQRGVETTFTRNGSVCSRL